MNMLQCSGNMKVPSIVASIMCLLDVVFNYFLIFPARTISLFGNSFKMYGAGLGVAGAQLGTSFATAVSMFILLVYAITKEKKIAFINEEESWIVEKDVLKQAMYIGVPMAMEQCATTGAQVVSTRIVAPLGTVAISLLYAGLWYCKCFYNNGWTGNRCKTERSCEIFCMANYIYRNDHHDSNWMFDVFFVPVCLCIFNAGRRSSKIGCLFAASIVANGALRGASDTLVPGIINLVSIWGVRITLAYFLSKSIGLQGAWIAMAVELSVRGILFLIRLKKERWLANC